MSKRPDPPAAAALTVNEDGTGLLLDGHPILMLTNHNHHLPHRCRPCVASGRVVAAWNANAGFTREQLEAFAEAGGLAALVEAAAKLLRLIDEGCDDYGSEVDALDAALVPLHGPGGRGRGGGRKQGSE